jgi:hypothetical protein
MEPGDYSIAEGKSAGMQKSRKAKSRNAEEQEGQKRKCIRAGRQKHRNAERVFRNGEKNDLS